MATKPKPAPQLLTDDQAVLDAAAELIASGEVAGKMLEQTLLHKPQGLNAKRLLLIGGGKARNFSSTELRKIAGAAVRSLKSKGIKSFAIVAPAEHRRCGQVHRRRRARRQLRSRLLPERSQRQEDRRLDHRCRRGRSGSGDSKPSRDASSARRRTLPATLSTSPATT